MKRVVGLLLLALVFTGCSVNNEMTETTEETTETVVVENKVKEEAIEDVSLEVNDLYNLSTKEYSDDEKGINIRYLQMENYEGELIQDYINQGLAAVVDQYIEADYLKAVELSPVVWMADENTISVTYEGRGILENGREIELLVPANIDIASSNDINYYNLIKDDSAVREILGQQVVEQGLADELVAEGIRVYMNSEKVFFAYMPLDDTATELIRVGVKKELIEKYLNTDFGEHPAS